MIEAKQKQRFIDILKKGESKIQNIGVEIEHIVVDNNFNTVNYYQRNGIEDILKNLLPLGYQGEYYNNYLVGLSKGENTITLEPGGQLEISIKEKGSIKKIKDNYFEFISDLAPILSENNQYLLAVGYHPKTSITEIPFNPKPRYKQMATYFEKKGKLAHNMMKGTASIQVSIDYTDEEDFAKKFAVANFLTPLIAILTDNSPRFEGQNYKRHSIRTKIWQNTDNDRSGIVPYKTGEFFGYDDYAEYLINVPPICVLQDGKLSFYSDKKTKDILDPETFTDDEVEHLMGMVFPDARAKKYIEIRSADSMPYPLSFAFIAFIKGVFYNQDAIDYFYNLSQYTSSEDIEKIKAELQWQGYKTKVVEKNLEQLANEAFDFALDKLDKEEVQYLNSIKMMIKNKENPKMYMEDFCNKYGQEAFKCCAVTVDTYNQCTKIKTSSKC
ncbi:glutamate-cysteine ligase family protein [Proteinivorax tanatarense]|uniref:Glutamate--cysteine ligase n=1 Tax=Proteinivorax tanatarense TaxID=1260629 RepID=A0AAU7VNV8_9FIRM